MVISSVVFDGGFHQVHQDSSAELVITGSGLDGVTDVTFDGRFVARLVSRTAAEVRFTVFVSFGVTGPRDVTVVSPSESVTVPEAIEITPWVFGPGAAPGGRGTFESPLALAEYSSGAGHGDTLLFLPGEHRSDGTASVDGSAIMRADPGPGFDQGTSIFLREVSIAGGQIGVHANGFPDDNQLSMRDCVVKDQTIASVRFDNDQSLFNFGNDGAGGNQLSVVSGVALEDLRDDPSSDAIPAQGITLNGRSYAGHGRRRGLVEGPIDVSPDYRILAAGRIQF